MAKALNRFMKEDPTFRVSTDQETGETIIAGMGELHLDIYVERMRREYKANVTVGAPNVSYREAPTVEAEFNYHHKKQTGGSGQYAHVVGRLIPLPVGSRGSLRVRGQRHRRSHSRRVHPGREQGLPGGHEEGPAGRVRDRRRARCVLDDGSYHAVDSSEMAFRIAARDAFVEAFRRSKPCLLEPIMKVEVETPREFQGTIVGDLNTRRGMIMAAETRDTFAVIRAEVPLASMFGYATIVRSLSKGMATFTMEMSRYAQVPARIAEEIIAKRREKSQQTAKK